MLRGGVVTVSILSKIDYFNRIVWEALGISTVDLHTIKQLPFWKKKKPSTHPMVAWLWLISSTQNKKKTAPIYFNNLPPPNPKNKKRMKEPIWWYVDKYYSIPSDKHR